MMFRCFLALWVFASCRGADPKYALRMQSVTLDPGLARPPDDILWKHNGNKVIEFDGNQEKVYGPFEGRVSLDWHSAELSIEDLRYEDSGDYGLEAYTRKLLTRFDCKLEVMDKVAKPTISCEMNDGGSSNKSGLHATLMCSAEPRQSQASMKFSWRSHRGVQPGPQLTIPLGDENDDQEYSCTVSNPLTKEAAAFTAKDCYREKSTAGLIAGICAVVALAVCLGVMFLKRKACCAKEKRDDVEKRSPHESADEDRILLDRAPTFPSRQPLSHLTQSNEKVGLPDERAQAGSVRGIVQQFETQDIALQKTTEVGLPDERAQAGSVKGIVQQFETQNIALQKTTGLEKTDDEDMNTAPPHRLGRKPSLPLELATKNQEDADVGQHGDSTECDPSDSERANDAPRAVRDDHSEDTQSDVQASIASEQPVSESEREPDEEANSDRENGVSPPAAQPQSPLAQTSTDMALGDGEHREGANSDQVTGEPTEERVGETDSQGLEEGNESGELSEVKDSSTTPKQKDEETTGHEKNSKLAQSETHSEEDDHQERDRQVPEDNNESDGVSDQHEIDEGESLPSDTSQQPQSPVTSKPDNSNTNTFVESPDDAQTVPDQEERDKSRQSSQSDSGTEDADKGEAAEDKDEVQSGPEKGKVDNESFSEDKEGQK